MLDPISAGIMVGGSLLGQSMDGGGSDISAVDPYAGTGYRELFKSLTEYLQPSVGGVTPYPGQIAPGASPLQQAGFDVAGGLTPIASGGQQYFGNVLNQADPSAANRFMGMAEQGLQGSLSPFDPSTVTEGLKPGRDLAMNTFFREFLPRLKENIVGRAGTADAGALQKLAVQGGEDMSMGLAAQSFPYLFQGQQNQLGRQQQGVNQAMNLGMMPGNIVSQAGQIGGMGADMGSQLINAGGIQRGITGDIMGEAAGKWQFQQPWANPYINVMSSLGGSAPQMDYINQQQGPNMMSQMMPMIGSFLGSPGGQQMTQGMGNSLGGMFGMGGVPQGFSPNMLYGP